MLDVGAIAGGCKSEMAFNKDFKNRGGCRFCINLIHIGQDYGPITRDLVSVGNG